MLKGHEKLQAVSATTGAVALLVSQFSPGNLGDRPNQVAPAFLRYRFRRLRVVFKTNLSTTHNGTLSMGIADDTDVTATPNPTSAQIMSMRKAVQWQCSKNTALTWTPIDKAKWYYVDSENSNADARFTIPASLFLISDQSLDNSTLGTSYSGVVGVIDIYYEIEFAGATSIAV